MTVLKKPNLEKAVNDGSRKIHLRGSQAIVPLKFDSDGEVVNESTPPQKLVLKRLSLKDFAFLKAWRENDWDIEKTSKEISYPLPEIERLVKKLQCFREEDAKVKALAQIPTTAWITAKHVENVFEGGSLQESEQKSLQELAKISGAYKPVTSVNIQANILQMPELSPEQAKAAKDFFDTMALEDKNVAA